MLQLDQPCKAHSDWLESVLFRLINTLSITWYLSNKSRVNFSIQFWDVCVCVCLSRTSAIFFKTCIIFMVAQYSVAEMDITIYSTGPVLWDILNCFLLNLFYIYMSSYLMFLVFPFPLLSLLLTFFSASCLRVVRIVLY